jgi:hypothetical protein
MKKPVEEHFKIIEFELYWGKKRFIRQIEKTLDEIHERGGWEVVSVSFSHPFLKGLKAFITLKKQ